MAFRLPCVKIFYFPFAPNWSLRLASCYGDKKWIVENTTMFPIGIYRVDNWCGFPTFLSPLAVLATIIHGWKRMMRMMGMIHTQVQSWILIEISIANPRFNYTWSGNYSAPLMHCFIHSILILTSTCIIDDCGSCKLDCEDYCWLSVNELLRISILLLLR